MKRKISLFILIFIIIQGVFSQENISIMGVIDWETFQINSTVTLDLRSAGLRLPAGRNQAEAIISYDYERLIRQIILDLQITSSSTIKDLIENNELAHQDIDALIRLSAAMPPALSQDMRNISASYSIPFSEIGNTLQKHSVPSPVAGILTSGTSARYTGIVIIASEELPAHGMRNSYLPVPCLFPKIWDTEMNLIYERRMAMPGIPVAKYSSNKNILYNSPSGLSPELEKIAGDRPLRIFARGVFGTNPTDLIIDREDALLILANEGNRKLLAEGKVVIILDESVLKEEFYGD